MKSIFELMGSAMKFLLELMGMPWNGSLNWWEGYEIAPLIDGEGLKSALGIGEESCEIITKVYMEIQTPPS